MKFDYLSIVEYWPLVLRGLWLTLAASGLGLIFSLVIGAIVAMARLSRSRIVTWAATTYVEFGRNLPFIIVLFLLFYVLPAYGFRLPAFVVGVIALVSIPARILRRSSVAPFVRSPKARWNRHAP